MKRVVWLSGGVSSFIAGYCVRDMVDEWIYIDIEDQHPDTMRFIKDCERVLGVHVTILRSEEFRNVESVLRRFRFINSPHGAPCTGMLKKAVRKKWENEQFRTGETDLCYIWGLDAGEVKRAERIKESFPEFTHEFPLIDRILSKQDCHAWIDRIGIKRPAMYDLGYNNNNCVGCVKGGKWYWNRIRVDFPEVFEARAQIERDLKNTFITGVSLDELDPDAGRKNEEISQDCSIMCFLAMEEKKEKR